MGAASAIGLETGDPLLILEFLHGRNRPGVLASLGGQIQSAFRTCYPAVLALDVVVGLHGHVI